MIKATNHRKRHIPPGPCGIWFQTQQHQHPHNHPDHGNNTNDDEDVTPSTQSEPTKRQPMIDIHFSPAWSCMQQELNWITPYLPPTMINPQQRYQHIRPHVPQEFALLVEIQRGDYDQFDQPLEQALVVLVASVETQIHIWTVELKDETGCSIKAWIEPKLVQHQQLEHSQSIIRPGVVWRLNQVGMIVVPVDEERLERMLLVRGSAIVQVWTPEQYGAADSPEQQRKFLHWMEQRKALPLVGISSEMNQETMQVDIESFPEEKEDPDEGLDGNDFAVWPRHPTVHDVECNSNHDQQQSRSQISPPSQASSRPITQAFSQPWSRPRLEEEEDATKTVDDEDPTLTVTTESAIHTQEPLQLPNKPIVQRTIELGRELQTRLGRMRNEPETSALPNVEHPVEKDALEAQNNNIAEASQSFSVATTTLPISQDRSKSAQGKTTATTTKNPAKEKLTPMKGKTWKMSCENSSFWNSILDEEDDSEDDPIDTTITSNATDVGTRSSLDERAKNVGEDDVGVDTDEESIPNLANIPSLFDASQFGNMDFEALLPDDDDAD